MKLARIACASLLLFIRFVDFTVFSFEFDRVRCALVGAFLVRNWCGDASVWTRTLERAFVAT